MESIKTVRIPACENHRGFRQVEIKLTWICPVCGGPRGEIRKAFSFDGSLRLVCDGWLNPCGHVDKYEAVRKEARENGLNYSDKTSRLINTSVNDLISSLDCAYKNGDLRQGDLLEALMVVEKRNEKTKALIIERYLKKLTKVKK